MGVFPRDPATRWSRTPCSDLFSGSQNKFRPLRRRDIARRPARNLAQKPESEAFHPPGGECDEAIAIRFGGHARRRKPSGGIAESSMSSFQFDRGDESSGISSCFGATRSCGPLLPAEVSLGEESLTRYRRIREEEGQFELLALQRRNRRF